MMPRRRATAGAAARMVARTTGIRLLRSSPCLPACLPCLPSPPPPECAILPLHPPPPCPPSPGARLCRHPRPLHPQLARPPLLPAQRPAGRRHNSCGSGLHVPAVVRCSSADWERAKWSTPTRAPRKPSPRCFCRRCCRPALPSAPIMPPTLLPASPPSTRAGTSLTATLSSLGGAAPPWLLRWSGVSEAFEVDAVDRPAVGVERLGPACAVQRCAAGCAPPDASPAPAPGGRAGLEKHGGRLLLRSHVEEILVEGGRAAGGLPGV